MDYSKNANLIASIRHALKEDTGKKDITTTLLIPKEKRLRAVLLAKENGVVCGIKIASLVFRLKDKNVKFKPAVSDGEYMRKGGVIARIEGNARSILTAERVALNFLTLLSGVATKTRQYVNRIRPYKVKIMDTRKTVPGLRDLQKYAVRIGGGLNHRMKLDEMVLIKDNHLQIINPKFRYKNWQTRQLFWRAKIPTQKLADSPIILASQNPKQIPISKFKIQSLKDVIAQIRSTVKSIKIEVEVKNLKEFKEALKARPDIVMLDNMKITDIKKAVEIRNNLRPKTYDLRPKLEASGGITLENVKRFAAAGVDMISIGDLTHSVKAFDMSLETI